MGALATFSASVFNAFSVIICGVFFASLILGAYVFYASEIGNTVNYEYPINSVIGLYGGEPVSAVGGITIGQIFAVSWTATVLIAVVSVLGPKMGYFAALESMRSGTVARTPGNYMLQATRWFAILVLVSVVIITVQAFFGFQTLPPETRNELVDFYQITNAPYIEEGIFRVLLIGVPLYLAYSHKSSARHFLRSLWHPAEHLHVDKKIPVMVLIAVSAALFGAAHILLGEPWTAGKMLQAAAAGMILGWVYFRHGLAAALLIHIMVNYTIYAVTSFVAIVSESSIAEAQGSQFVGTLEVLFLAAGVSAAAYAIFEIRGRNATCITDG